jgi:UDP-glucose 4-epimerase
VPPEMLSQLRFGRGLDNRKLKATGFDYRYTSRETVLKLAEHLRLEPILRGARESYTYERDVEDFVRRSPHVRRTTDHGPRTGEPPAPEAIEIQVGDPEPDTPDPTPDTPPVEHYDDLEAEEIISLLGSLEGSDLEALLDHERDTRARDAVVGAIEAVLARRAMGSRP